MDNSDYASELQDTVALNIKTDINKLLQTPNSQLQAIMNITGSEGIIGDPIENSAEVRSLDINYGASLWVTRAFLQEARIIFGYLIRYE